jgi:hypothetical protein
VELHAKFASPARAGGPQTNAARPAPVVRRAPSPPPLPDAILVTRPAQIDSSTRRLELTTVVKANGPHNDAGGAQVRRQFHLAGVVNKERGRLCPANQGPFCANSRLASIAPDSWNRLRPINRHERRRYLKSTGAGSCSGSSWLAGQAVPHDARAHLLCITQRALIVSDAKGRKRAAGPCGSRRPAESSQVRSGGAGRRPSISGAAGWRPRQARQAAELDHGHRRRPHAFRP